MYGPGALTSWITSILLTHRAHVMHTWHLGGKMNTHLKYRKGKGEAGWLLPCSYVNRWLCCKHSWAITSKLLEQPPVPGISGITWEILQAYFLSKSLAWPQKDRCRICNAIVLSPPCCESESWPPLWTERQPCNKLRKCWHHCKSYSLTITYRFLIRSGNFILPPIPMNLFSLNV